jgi:hypothetical protein
LEKKVLSWLKEKKIECLEKVNTVEQENIGPVLNIANEIRNN